MSLFRRDINDWTSWTGVFQSIDAWRPLIEYIFKREGLPLADVEHLTPGTNAVFKIGGFVIKIFAPLASGLDTAIDIQTETFAIKRLAAAGIAVPKILASSAIEDKYLFRYMIMEFIEGRSSPMLPVPLATTRGSASGRECERSPTS